MFKLSTIKSGPLELRANYKITNCILKVHCMLNIAACVISLIQNMDTVLATLQYYQPCAFLQRLGSSSLNNDIQAASC